MKGNMKHINIKGVLKSRGEYRTKSPLYRPYEAVTFIDAEDNEVHFNNLIISKRMDDALNLNETMTFYILRIRFNNQMNGVMYAVDTGSQKLFYSDTAVKAVRDFGMHSTMRHQFIKSPQVFVFMMAVGGAALWAGLTFAIKGIDPNISGFLGFGIVALYMVSPMMFKDGRVGMGQMNAILRENGFISSSEQSALY